MPFTQSFCNGPEEITSAMPDASPTSRLDRIAAMERRELFDRLRQYVTARADVLLYRSGHNFQGTVKIEPAASTPRFFFTPAEVPALCSVLKQVFPKQADNIVLQAEKICCHRFDLLGHEDLD